MNNRSIFPSNTLLEESEESSLLISQDGSKSPQGLSWVLQWWYRITSPPEPDDSASFEERELFRRGRTGSQITIFLFILLLISFPAAFAGSNPLLIAIVVIDLFALTFAMVLNRLKKVSIAGVLVVLCFVASPTVNILTTPGGVNTSAMSIFSLLVLPLMCAASFLPPWWVFVVAAGNCIFTVYVLAFLPTSGELHQVLKVAFPGVVTPIILSQGIVSIVAFLWVRGATQALLRADHAEMVARLEHDMVLQGAEAVAEQKQQLDNSIQSIVATHTRVANGDYDARVPLTQDNVLWQISGALNNLLARFQRLRQESVEAKKMQFALKEAREEIVRLKRIVGKESDPNRFPQRVDGRTSPENSF